MLGRDVGLCFGVVENPPHCHDGRDEEDHVAHEEEPNGSVHVRPKCIPAPNIARESTVLGNYDLGTHVGPAGQILE